MMNRSVITVVIACLLSLTLISIGLAAFATTKIYFNVPSVTTFAIGMPDTYASGQNFTITGGSVAAANSTDYISFNFSGTPASWVQPYAAGNASRAQNNTSTPIFLLDNLGNTNITISFWLNDTGNLSTYFNFSANATSSDTAGCALVQTTPFNITATSTNITWRFQPSSCRVNVSMWGFAESSAPAGPVAGFANLITNSSAG